MLPTASQLALAALLTLGCANNRELRAPPDGVILSRTEVESLRQAKAEVETLRAEVQDLHRRLAFVEQRVGLAALDPTRIRKVTDASRLEIAGSASFVEGPGSRGRKRDLGRHLEAFDGYVVSFWATWCKPCISDEELVHLKTLQQQLRRHNIELVSIAVDELDKVQGHAKAARWLYPLWQRQDAHLEMLPKSLMSKVGVGLPLFLVVSREGTIRYVYSRKLDDDAVRDMVSAVATVCRL